MPPTVMLDDSQTWAIRPRSLATQADIPPVPKLPVGFNKRINPGLSSLAPVHKEDTGEDSEEDFDTFRQNRWDDPESGPAYKPSFSKATFQWMRGELLGWGSYGRVYLGLNATTGEIMAVKQVELPKTASDKINKQQLDVVKALKFEIDTLKDLDHPNIVQYLGFEESQDFISIFLEYVPGGTITALLRQHGRLREEVTTSFLYQILSGLEYLHARKILHRDLKSDNILVELSGVCKISDFGISKKADDLNPRPHTMMRGTVYWMAPEMILSEGKGYDMKVDIWSVGCIALEMWSGSRPWSDLLYQPVMMKLGKDRLHPPVPSGIQLSSLAEAFRLECFHVDPEARPPARVLKKHRYLQPSENWIFDITDVADSATPPSSISQFSPPGKNRSPWDDQETAKPVLPPSKQPSKPLLPPLCIPDYKPSDLPLQPTVRRKPSGAVSRSTPPPDGPPLVHITPPGPPRARSSEDNRVLSSVSETSQTRPRRPRVLIIANPDSTSEGSCSQAPTPSGRKPAFVYTPPPLPDASTLSASISPSPKVSKIPENITPTSSSSLTTPASRPPLSSSFPPSAGAEHPAPSSASASVTRSPRPLPPSPAPIQIYSNSHSFQSGYTPRDRTQTAPQPTSSHHNKDMGSTAYKAAHTQQRATHSILNGKTVRKLPISPPQLRTSASIAHLPSTPTRSPSRFLVKQKSVPDVSIFAFNDPSTRRNPRPALGPVPHRSFSMDSDLELDGAISNTISNGHPLREPPASTSTHPISNGKQQGSLALRPKAEDVYEHLESWFPHHDLDQPVDSSATSPDGRPAHTEQRLRQKKADGRKSIRMIAKEQNSRSNINPGASRRRTMLWNSYVKELKSQDMKWAA